MSAAPKLTQDEVIILEAAVHDCDRMLVMEEVRNSNERSRSHDDVNRLVRYQARRAELISHRRRLVELYVMLLGVNPWEDVAF